MAFVLSVAMAVWLPDGRILVEAEDFARCDWLIIDEAEASGQCWIRSNQPEQIAETTVHLPEGEYQVWVRCADNGHYPGHYQFRVTLNGQHHWAARSEPLAQRLIWEPLGSIAGGAVSVRVDQADSWSSACDAFLFVPDGGHGPSGPPQLTLLSAESSSGRKPGAVSVEFAGPPDGKGECWVALRRDGLVMWSAQGCPIQAARVGPDRCHYRVAIATPAFRYLAAGPYTVTLEWGRHQWVGRREGDHTVATIELALEPPPRPLRACVSTARGEPELLVNGRPMFPFAFLGVHRGRYGEFGAHGCHLYSVPCGLGNRQEGQFDPAEPDAAAREVLARDPEALLLFRVQLEPPESWLIDHPSERVLFDDGSLGPQSFASKLWLDRITGDLRRFVEHVRTSPYADRVVGLHLCTGYSAEWQSWGLWDDRRGDYSPAFTEYFREWLKRRYKTDSALARAWRRPGLTLRTASVPSRQRREATGGLLRDPIKDRAVIDFYEAYAQAAADAIVATCSAVKESSQGHLLAGVFYGYAVQHGSLAAESQHLGLLHVLDAPVVDFVCAPAMYTDRGPGGVSAFMSLTGSVKLHGKLWFNESDIRTHLQADPIGRCVDWAQTCGVLKREYAAVRSRGAGQWWFDMTDGWFSSSEILSLFGEMNRLGQRAALAPPRSWPEPEIAVVFSQRSALRHGGGCYAEFWFSALTAQMAALDRIGAPSVAYHLEDTPDLSRTRLVVLLNAFDLTPSEYEWIEGLKSDGRAILFVSASGVGRTTRDGHIREDLAAMRALIGQDVRPVGVGGLRVHLLDDPLCAGLSYADPAMGMASDSFGPGGAYPVRYAAPEGLRVLGTLPDGVPALTTKDFGEWLSVYSASPGLPPGLLRNIARLAGAHLFSDTDDAFYAGRGIVALHARTAGHKVISLPEPLRVRDLWEGGEVRYTDRIEFDASAEETRVFDVDAP